MMAISNCHIESIRLPLFLATVILTVMYEPVAVQAQSDSVITVEAGEQYAAGAFHRLLFGDLWRDMWIAPVNVPILELRREAGGLTPLRLGGGAQTLSLRFRGGDGREYKFRLMDKDLTKTVPPEFRNTFVARIVQDLVSTANPYGALVAAPILDAADVLHAEPRLAILPDDPVLGEFREEFANRLGFIEIHPDEFNEDEIGFAGSDKIVGTFSLLEKLQKDTEDRAHAPSYLKARILDIFMGDWDRHTDQWRWARFEDAAIDWWHPIPRDRDQAFCRYDGFIPWLATVVIPQLESCDDDYPQLQYLAYSGRYLDRRFLTGLSWETYDSLLQFLLPVLTDSLLSDAVSRLPSGPGGIDAEPVHTERLRLYTTLQKRRDALAGAMREYYEMLSSEADIRCSDEDELVEVHRLMNGDVTVNARSIHPGKRGRMNAQFFQRTFHADETREIRVFLEGGDDHCIVSGNSPAEIILRVIGGRGKDRFVDSSLVESPLFGFLPVALTMKMNYFFDDGSKSEFVRGPSTVTDRSSVAEPATPQEQYEPALRDWGSEWEPGLMGAWDADLGLMLGGGPVYKKYGFRTEPYAVHIRLDAGIAPLAMLGKAVLTFDFRNPLPGAELHLDVGFSSFEVINYFGSGNETAGRNDQEFSYAVRQTQVFLTPSMLVHIAPALQTFLGASLRLVTNDLDDERLYLSEIQPIGYDQTTLFNLEAMLSWDTRDSRAWPSKGLFASLTGKYFPAMLDQKSKFSSVRAEARAYLSADILFPWTLAMRAGAQQVSIGHPFFEAAFLGGLGSARGLERNRYAGDSMLFGGLEWRTYLFPFHILFPSELGIFCFSETGRVFQKDEHSESWHSSWGGGIWIAPVTREFTVSASVGISRDHLRIDVAAGLAF
jgi:hypothetical protein